MESTKHACEAVKSDGSRCQAAALPGSEFCFFHDPSKAAERREAHAAGGRQNRMRTLDRAASDVKIEDSGDVIALLSETINQVRKGLIDPRVANSVGYLANIAIRVFAQDEMENRIAKLEQLLERRSKLPELMVTGRDNVKRAQ
jgi:hypothetical protein